MRAQKNVPEQLKLADFADKTLLILDDDDPLRETTNYGEERIFKRG